MPVFKKDEIVGYKVGEGNCCCEECVTKEEKDDAQLAHVCGIRL